MKINFNKKVFQCSNSKSYNKNNPWLMHLRIMCLKRVINYSRYKILKIKLLNNHNSKKNKRMERQIF